jgi:hypothetical protein
MTKEMKKELDEADAYAAANTTRMTHEEVFGELRRRING